MGKKRKQLGNVVAAEIHKEEDEVSKERPKRTLLGWKDKEEDVVGKVEDVVGKEVGSLFRNKEKVLVTCSRRISCRYRHLMQNIISLLPHCKKENKIESREIHGVTLNEMVELRNCSSCLFFECRKLKDLYIWMGKSPNGPSAKFLVNAVHTMEELKLTGNHLKGSRPILTFSSNFNSDPRWQLLKEMITQIFATPKEHRKAKPFFDHVLAFSIADDHIWFRNFQIADQGGIEKTTLVEVGPRFCLNPIRIFAGSFGGPTLYQNPLYVSPNQIRALERKQKAGKYAQKIKAKTKRKMHKMSYPLEGDEFADIWRE